jgi:pimeloyl-ACP methyl ester carboxylesterase
MTLRSPFLLCLGLAFSGLAPLRADEPVPPRRLSGEIACARWAALVPENWDGRILLEAPDIRHAPAPLVAELDDSTPDHTALLAAGWALATTSYRRTGPILVDAIDDLIALRDRLAADLGRPKMVLVAGTGMGGLIATIIAERHSDEFHGGLAIDPTLDLRDPRALRLRRDGQPRGPLLFLFGPSTARAVIAYNDRATAVANAESTVPVLWYRDAGTEAEPGAKPVSLPAAAEALAAWIQTRRPPASRLDTLPTIDDLPQPESATTDKNAAPAEAPLLPDEPPPTVPVDDGPAAAK